MFEVIHIVKKLECLDERTYILQDRLLFCYNSLTAVMNDRDSNAFNPLSLLSDMGNQFETPPKEADSSGLHFAGTTPPRTTNSNSPKSAEAIEHAFASSAEKWRDISDVGNNSIMNGIDNLDPSATASTNTNDPIDEVDLYSDPVNVLMSPSCPPLPSFKTEENASAEDSPSVEAKGQPFRDSPDIESTGSDSSVDVWQTRFEELKAYKAKHNDLEVPQKYGPLGVWVNKQRNEYTNLDKKGVKSQMTQERISQLNSIGFRWAQPYGEKLWETRFNELKEYKEKVRQIRQCPIGCCRVCEVFITFLLAHYFCF
jgi:hypothetical protein